VSRVLVTGASGFVGTAVVDALRAFGHQARGVTRAETGELSAVTEWSRLLDNVEAVVHCAGRAHVPFVRGIDPMPEARRVNCDATLALARTAASRGLRRMIFMSTAHVNGSETHGAPFKASDTPAPHSPYALTKNEAELGLRAIAAETGLDVVIIRPPLVLGRDPKGNLASLLNMMRQGLPLPFGLVTRNRRDLVSLTTLTDLIRICVDHPAAAGATLLVSDGIARSTRAICEELARLSGVVPRFLPVPPFALDAALTLLGKTAMTSQLLGDLEIDIGATKTLLSWAPPELH